MKVYNKSDMRDKDTRPYAPEASFLSDNIVHYQETDMM